MIYDCFPFFNELDILEIRLNELNNVVDRFVIVEANKTFQNKEKDFIFEANKDRFQEFLEKITYVKIYKFPVFNLKKFRFSTAWDRSNFQKNQVIQGLENCTDNDIIIISDLDEIPKASLISEAINKPGIKVFQQLHANYFLNCISTECPNEDHLIKKGPYVYWKGSVMHTHKEFKSFKHSRLQRNYVNDNITQIENGGWHFSFIGEIEKLILKLNSWEHAKEKHYNNELLESEEGIKKIIESGDDLFGREFKYKLFDPQEILPEYVKTNIDKYKHIIK